ncbi:efflux RND transporter periplasmic adaptor subunit [Hydrogenophaga crocea]|uniref:Efflux RND transporter periplasmic adaptor subunit n=1 Tax=Hydrogenophaga crocea TaxID=2716225 RepID=A0A6G8IHB2_9BURK|nr:efflux RND transporter periplasmic adaptor subunit [Hydrogenophaga crocea]QIM52360.1 efflux RND transporter periplasmic adaptor subunit [Hydrogenophaga crocea]
MNDSPPVRAPKAAFVRRHPWGSALIALSALALIGGGAYAWFRWGPGAKTESTYITATIQRGDIEDQVAATGSLQPRDYVDVGAQVSGQLRKLHVEVGSEVKEGDLLAEIDAETSQARVDASRAQLRSQGAQLAERELALAKAERDLQRQKNLMAEEATTTETLQNAETTLRTARAQINALKAQMEQVKASMRVEEANLKYTKIYAPMSGTVVSITARQGQTLNTNQQAPTLLRVADLSVMTVQTQVSEADVSKLRTGMPVYFTTLGSQGRRWYGELKKIEPTPTVTNNVVLYNALFEVPNTNRNLMTQMTAQVFFVVAEAKDVLMVPMSALTIQRGPQGGRERAAQPGASPAAPAAAPAAAAPLNAPAAPPAAPPAAAAPRFDREAFEKMTPEERERVRAQRREAFQNLSEEERQKLRDQRRQAREAADAQPGSGPGAGPGAAARAAPPAGPAPRSLRGPRQAKARVMLEDGSIEERELTIGISNRVHAEVLSGLKEGERVIAGTRDAEPPRRNPPQGTGLGQPGFGGPGGPGGAPGGAAGGARR